MRTIMEVNNFLSLVLSSVVLSGGLTSAAKILIVPVSINSHHVFFGQLAFGLKGLGHDITILAATNSKIPNHVIDAGINVMRYQGEVTQYASSHKMAQFMMKVALADSLFEKLLLSIAKENDPGTHYALDCEGLYNDTNLIEKIRKTKFDFAVLDPVYPSCYYAIIYKLGIPYASFSIPLMTYSYRAPHFSSQTPNYFLGGSDNMNFMTRVRNTLLDLIECFAVHLLIDGPGDYVQRIAPEKPHLWASGMLQNSKLWFYLSDPVLSYPRPMMPNMILLGDIMIRQAQPLSSDLEELVSGAKHGVVVVSFGSMMTALPENETRIILDGLGKLKQLVVMKKPGFIPENVPDNIKLLHWLPQNDLLGHEKTKVFISHCGLNSLLESVNHGVPVVSVPIALDQPYNAMVVQDKGLGKQLILGKFTADDLKRTVEEVMYDETYTVTAKRMSQIFHDKPNTAVERASYMIEHVIKYGDSHLRTKAFDLNLFQFYMFDVYIFLILCIVIFITVLIILLKLLSSIIIRCCCKRQNKMKNE